MLTHWLFALTIALTALCWLAVCASAYYWRACRSTDTTKSLRGMAIEIAALSSDVEKIAHQLRKHHMRQAMRDHAERASEASEPGSTVPSLVNGDDKDAIRKTLGAQAGMIGARR
jgi:hypothetical protein